MLRVLVIALVLAASPARAILVDNGDYTSDTVSGLDWLDLSITSQITMVDALAANPGWRLATNAEVEDLFDQVFIGYTANEPRGYDSSSSFGGLSVYAGHHDHVALFTSLFGYTRTNQHQSDTIGLYIDEGGLVKSLGVRVAHNPYNSVIWGLEDPTEFPAQYSSVAPFNQGTFLVRSSVVPIPAAAWLFGSALVSLGWLRRKPNN